MLRVGYFCAGDDGVGPETWEGCSLCSLPLSGPLVRLGSRKQTRWFHRDCLIGVVDASFQAHPDDAVIRWHEERRRQAERQELAREIIDSYRTRIRERERSRFMSSTSACLNAKDGTP
jgi:hypothetical protein